MNVQFRARAKSRIPTTWRPSLVDRKASFRRKLAALCIGSLFAVLAFEAALRLFVLRPVILPPVPTEGENILCIGGRHTNGSGVFAAANYCRHLRELARMEKRDGLNFIPLGRLGWNSTEILAALPNWLARYRPHRVLVQASGDDFFSCRPRERRTYVARFFSGLVGRLGWSAVSFDRSHRDLVVLEEVISGARMEMNHADAAEALRRIYEEGAGRGIRAAAAARMLARLAADEPFSHREQLAWLEKSYDAEPTIYNRGLLDDLTALRHRAGFPLALDNARRILQSRLDEARRATAMHADLVPIFQLDPGTSPSWDSQNLVRLEACYDKPDCRMDIHRLIRSRPGDAVLRRISFEIGMRQGDIAFASALLVDWLNWNPTEGRAEPVVYAGWLRRDLRAPRYAASAESLDAALAAAFPLFSARSWWISSCPSREKIFSELEVDLGRIRELVTAAGSDVVLQTAAPSR